MDTDGHKRKLAVILAADVEGYSRLMGADEEATLDTLAAYHQAMDACIVGRGGRVVGSAGDSLLAEFPSAVEAVRCGAEIQDELGRRNADLEPDRRMDFRIGIKLGDVIAAEGDIFGDGVNVAARLENIADAGGVCISGAVYDQVKGKLELDFQDLGAQKVKNIVEPVHAYRVCLSDGNASAPVVESLAETPSVAVLPFDNMSADPEQEYFSDGMTEDIITTLSKLSGLFVIARNSTFTYKGRAVKVQDVGTELGVRYVVEGSVRKAGERIRVTAQLVEAATGHHLWAERYDRTLEDVFEVQDELSREIATALQVTLSAGENGRLTRKPTDNLEVYDLLLRGREEMMRSTREATENARQLFQRALDLDPQCADAYARLAQVAHLTAVQGWGVAEELSRQAMELVEKALGLDDSVAFAHGVLGMVFQWRHDFERALEEARRWIELDPNEADAHLNLGQMLTWAGNAEDALPPIEKSMRLNPHYSYLTLFGLGHAHWVLRHDDQALTAFNRGISRNSDFAPNHIFRAAILAERGEVEEARAAIEEVRRIGFDLSPGRLQWLPYAREEDLEHLRQVLLKLLPAGED